MKTKLLFVLMSLFLIASCGKKDEQIPKPDPSPTPKPSPVLPIAKGETHWMILSSTKGVGDTISLRINAAEADRKDVWIDLNANGKKEEGEAVTIFNKPTPYSLGAKSIAVYGKVSDLRCNKSNLIALDVSSNDALGGLFCQNNQISSLDVSKNPELLYLWCAFNALTDLDISKNTKLEELWIPGNKITDSGKMQKIVDDLPKGGGKFWVVETQTSKENIISKEQVKIARDKGWKVWDNKDQDYAGELADPTQTNKMILSTSKAVGDTISLRIDATKPEKKDVWIDLNNNGKKDEGEAVTEFSKHVNYSLGAKSIVVYGKVYELRCQESNLTALDVSSNDALELLYCYDNQLVSIDVSKNPALNEFRCHENQLKSLNVSKNPELLYLWCGYNELTELDISKNRKLKELWLSGNEITDAGKMQKIVDDLPNLKGEFWVVATQTSKENSISKEQVKIARDKGWKVQDDENKNYAGAATENPKPTIPIAEGETHYIILTTERPIGENIELLVNAAESDRAHVWIDLNNNGKKEDVEKVKVFGDNSTQTYKVSSQTIVIYGKISYFKCRNGSVTELDISKSPTLENLQCPYNNLTKLKLGKNRSLYQLSVHNNKIKATEMQNLIYAMPNRKSGVQGRFWVYHKDDKEEQNEITKKQAAILREKNWSVTDALGKYYGGK